MPLQKSAVRGRHGTRNGLVMQLLDLFEKRMALVLCTEERLQAHFRRRRDDRLSIQQAPHTPFVLQHVRYCVFWKR